MFANLFKDRLFIFLFLLVLLAGCSTWDNFTTYFNLYYNASELYEKAETQINEQKTDIFSTSPSTIPPAANADFQKVIEKCSNILQFSPNSSYVDDALMMLGKSFYYQKNYLKSRRQFEELITRESDSDYLLEAQLWTGKCDMRLRNYSDGITILKEVSTKALEEGEDEIVQAAFIEEVVYYKAEEDYASAIQTANDFLAVSDDSEINAIVWNEVGNLNMDIEDYEAAVKAYQNVFEFSPDFDLEVTANLNLGKALREVGENEQALTLFEDMRTEDKYEQNYSEIDLEIGISEASLHKYEEAIDQLTIVDTTYRNSSNSAIAKYEIASVYEYGLNQLDSAAVYYKKAATSQLPKEYIRPARDKDRLFSRYISITNTLDGFNEQLFYLQNPEEFKKDSALYVQDSLEIAKQLEDVQELQEIWSSLGEINSGVEDTTGYYQDSIKVVDTLITNLRDSLEFVNQDSVFYWIRNPEAKDSLIVAQFDSMFTNKIFDPEAKQKLELERRQREMLANQLNASLPDTIKFKNNPPKWPKISEDSLKTLIAKNQLDLGNLFLSEFDMPDSAYKYYYSNLTDYSDNLFYAPSLFAMGSYYLTVDNKQTADSLFTIIYDNYKNESIVNAAAVQLDKPLIDLDYDPALEKYTEAEKFIFEGDYSSALFQLEKIPEEFPKSDIAPKAIYASGWIEENELNDPDAAVEYYDTLVAQYPASEYVRIVAPKISLYKQEKRKEELALQDSLQAIAGTDSLSTDSLQVVQEITPKDTVQVAVSEEEQKPLQEETPPEVTTKSVIKEPLWNPRIRK